MDDETQPVSPDEFMTDVAIALIERDMLSGIQWRVPYTLAMVIDAARAVEDDEDSSDELKEFVRTLVIDIVQTLMYSVLDERPTEADIDRVATDFGSLFEDFERARLQKNDEQED